MDTLVFFSILRMLLLSVLSFAVAMAVTPALTFFLYKYKLGKHIRAAGNTPIFTQMHAHKQGTPTMGGILVWGTTAFVTLFFAGLAHYFPHFQALNFLSRSETWLLLAALLAAAAVGLLDDLMNVWAIGSKQGGMRFWQRLIMHSFIALVGAWWFYFKLDFDTVHIPLWGDVWLGPWYMLLFIVVIIATSFSVNETDGLDGLAGGVTLVALSAYAVIAFSLGRYDIAAFVAVLLGSLLAFLWFNIYPARFIMGDTGSMSLGVVLGILAMLTDTVFLLPILGFVLVAEALSAIVQLTSKKLFKRKIFISAPFHHHLEAVGWPEPKVVMRLWVISGIFVMMGMALFVLDRLLV